MFKNWLKQKFKKSVDFYWLLNMHSEKIEGGIKAFDEWLQDKNSVRCQIVRDLEHDADGLKLEIGKQLIETFVTPIDREDIYDLSQLQDEIINSTKYLVREIEAIGKPEYDKYIKEICQELKTGAKHLKESFANLEHNLKKASEEANFARKVENKIGKLYQQSVSNLLIENDIKKIIRLLEIYRGLLVIANNIDKVAEKLLHTIIKIL